MTNEKAKTFLSCQNNLKKAINAIEEEFGGKVAEQQLIIMLYNANWYFHDEFTDDEISRMQYNIASDFPIFLETSIGNLQQKVKDLQSQVSTMEAGIGQRNTMIADLETKLVTYREQLKFILNKLIQDISGEAGHDGCVNACLTQFTKNQIIMAKLEQGVALTEDELREVKSKMNNVQY